MRILRLAFDNWFSRAYWLLVAAVAVFVTISYATWDQPDANLAGVWLIFVTSPFSLIGGLLADSVTDSAAWFWVSMVLGALVNAVFIGAMARLYRRGRRTRTA